MDKQLNVPNLSLKPKFIPSLHDINKSFDVIKVDRYDGIKGEEKGRMTVFTNFVIGRKPIILQGPRAAGKTNLMAVVSVYCPIPIRVAGASEKADIRDDKLNDATHIIIPEVNKISANFQETLKDWGEGVETTYKTLNDMKRVVNFILKPKAFITSIADENDAVLGEELISRLTTIHMDSSIEQNKNVISDKLERAQNPFKKRLVTPEYVTDCINYVHGLPPIDKFQFIYLPGKSVVRAIPPRFTDSRRDIEKYLYNTYGIALFNYYNRIILNLGKDKNAMLITPEDVWLNHRIYGDNLIQSALKCGPQELLIINILRKQKEEHKMCPDLNSQEIYETILLNGITPTTISIQKMCDNLYKNGIIIKNIEKKPITYEASSFFVDFDSKINWKEIIEECKKSVIENFPSVADDYIKRFCTPPIIVVDPFNGKKVDIIDTTNIIDDGVTISENKKKDLHYFHKQIKQEDEVSGLVTEEESIEDTQESILDIDEITNRCVSLFNTESNPSMTLDIEFINEKFNKRELDVLITKSIIVMTPQDKYMFLGT